MSTMMVPVSSAGVPNGVATAVPQLEVVPASAREVLKCEHCKLVQFRTDKDCCRRCKKSLLPEPPKAQATALPSADTHTALKNEGLSVASAVRDLRQVRNLSQRQLAARMGVPRTYISKIENGKAMPTLSSLDRLARALQVDISALLRDTPNHHRDETAVLMADPFLAEIAKFSTHLTSTQKSIFLNHVRELAQASGQSGKNGIRRSA
jgi:transcriptional regulator with XRE-family HTH domain